MIHLSCLGTGGSQLSARTEGHRDCAPGLRIASSVHLVAMRATATTGPWLFLELGLKAALAVLPAARILDRVR